MLDGLSFICEDGSLLGRRKHIGCHLQNMFKPNSGYDSFQSIIDPRFARVTKHLEKVLCCRRWWSQCRRKNEISRVAIIGGEGMVASYIPNYITAGMHWWVLLLCWPTMAKENLSLLQIKSNLPIYYISKNKIDLQPHWNVNKTIESWLITIPMKKSTQKDGLKLTLNMAGCSCVSQTLSRSFVCIVKRDESESIALANKIIDQFIQLVLFNP